MKFVAVIGLISGISGSLLAALLCFATIAFNGFGGGPKAGNAGIVGVLYGVVAFAGIWGAVRIFNKPKLTFQTMGWLTALLALLLVVTGNLDIVVTPICLGPFLLAALLAWLFYRAKTKTA